MFRRVTVICFVCICFNSGLAQSKDDLYLKPFNTQIVLPTYAKDEEIKSAKLINKWLNRLYRSDSGFVIVRERILKIKEDQVLISIGNTRLDSVKQWDSQEPYSFRINRVKNLITLNGATPIATLFATNYFLDHFCGVRFYLPGELFVSEPGNKKIKLDDIKPVYEVPFTRYLYATGFSNKALETHKDFAEIAWAQFSGLQRRNWGSHQHSMGDRFLNDSTIKLFPEIFPTVKGKKYIPKIKQDQQWQPDFAEPTLVDAAVYSSINYFKANPSIDYISFSVQDSYAYPEEGKMGEYLKNYPSTREGKRRAYTNAFVDFLNQLAARLKEELPRNGITTPKTIVYIAYGFVSFVPLKKLDPWVLPISVYSIATAEKKLILSDTGTVSKWGPVTSRMGNHDWAEGRGFIYPRIYANLIAKYLRTVKKNKISFDYAHLECYPNWSLDGPRYYFMSKLYWNPELNPDSLLNLFCEDMFGSVKNYMKSYFSILEDLNSSMNNDSATSRNINGYLTQLPLNNAQLEMVNKARENLDKAYDKVKDTVQKNRIKFFSDGFKITEGLFDLYNSKNLDPAKLNQFKAFLEKDIAGNPLMLNIATDKDFIFRINFLIDQVIRLKK